MKAFAKVVLASLASYALAQKQAAEQQAPKKQVYENYSFDFSAHERPIAYNTFGNALELVNKVKVNPAVADRAGAYVFDSVIRDKEFEVELEFTVQSELAKANGFMVLLTQHEMFESEFTESVIGYRQNFEGIGLFVFRHPHRDNKWFAMTLQNQGTRSVLRLENHMYSGLRNSNHCEIDMDKGVRAGIRIQIVDKQVVTLVKDSDDVSYRECAKVGLMNKQWTNHHFAIAAKNSFNNEKEMLITDVDIDSIQISSLRPWEMYTAEAEADERSGFLLRRHAVYDEQMGESLFDVSRLFELNLAHDLSKEQKKTLAFIDDEDDFDELFFKHHQTLKRVEFNFARFNEQLENEIRDEEEFESHLMTSAYITESQKQLENLYSTAEDLAVSLSGILDESRFTLDQILAKENLQKKEGSKQKQFDQSQVKLNPAINSGLDAAHKVVDALIQSTQKTLERHQQFLDEFEKQYESEKKKEPAAKVGNSRRLDPAILDEIEDGVRELKQRIVNEYIETSSTFTICALVAIFAGLGFTFYKVNRMVNKAHMF